MNEDPVTLIEEQQLDETGWRFKFTSGRESFVFDQPELEPAQAIVITTLPNGDFAAYILEEHA